MNENDKIEGFHWRGGSDRVTSGIHIWSKPLVYEKESGEKVSLNRLSENFTETGEFFFWFITTPFLQGGLLLKKYIMHVLDSFVLLCNTSIR